MVMRYARYHITFKFHISITMLGDGRELKWEMTKDGLIVETPKSKPCDYAFTFKITRKKPV